MIKLEEMGTILMHIALQYTHPDFESMYSDWSTVHDIGEKLVKMSDQPQLNENQQIVLDGLKFIFVNYNQEFGTDDNIKYALRDFYWYLGTDYSISENKKIVSMCESYDLLSADEFAQVLELFSKWAQEQEEE